MGDLDRLKKWLFRMSSSEGSSSSSAALKPQLRAWSEQIQVPEPVVAILTDAFDEQRRLSSVKFPQLAELRNKEASLYRRIKSMVETLLATTLKGKMARRASHVVLMRRQRAHPSTPSAPSAQLSLSAPISTTHWERLASQNFAIEFAHHSPTFSVAQPLKMR